MLTMPIFALVFRGGKMKHREQRKRKQRSPLDAIHDQSDVEEHLAVGWGGYLGLFNGPDVGKLLGWER